MDQCHSTYHCSIGKKPIDADYSDLTENCELSCKATKFKIYDRFRITKYKNCFE